MIFQRINRTNPEKIFLVAYNSYATASLTNGQAVCWDYATDANGVSVTMPPAIAVNGGFAFAGIVSETIAAGAYGLIQVYGYHSAIRARASSTSGSGATKAIAKGTPLRMSQQSSTASLAATAFCLEACQTKSTTILLQPGAFAFAANALWTTAAIAGFIKAL
jgi:hypothetical protein